MGLNLQNANEADVREEIAAPLLSLLGYKRGTENDILREFSLTYDKIFLGRKKPNDPPLRGRADYILSVAGAGRWALETKASSEEITQDVIEQAISYARHPEVSARYAAVTNGHRFVVFCNIQSSEDKPIIDLSISTVEGLADQLRTMLSPSAIGRDKISDMTTNIIRKHLITYTQEQCNLHGIPLTPDVSSGRIWDTNNHQWTNEYVKLPVVENAKIILVPKASVRWSTAFDPREYYNDFVLSFLQDYHLNAHTGLVDTLKNGRKRVSKKSLKEIHPLSKDFLSEFTEQNPEVLEKYKAVLGVSKEIKDKDLDREFDEQSFATALMAALDQIPTGGTDAKKYHHFMAGVLEFLFYPNLIYPIKEHEINEGRKRIDITYTNNATAGFFYRRRTQAHVNAGMLFVECKNYSQEIANPELDQLAGRFSDHRGRLGFLVARKLDDRARFIKRCKDTALAGNGFIILMEDADIKMMLGWIESNHRPRIDTYLEQRFQELIN